MIKKQRNPPKESREGGSAESRGKQAARNKAYKKKEADGLVGRRGLSFLTDLLLCFFSISESLQAFSVFLPVFLCSVPDIAKRCPYSLGQ